MNTIYRYILKPILFLFSADTVHGLFISIGEFIGRFTFARWFLVLFYKYRGPNISKTVDGITYRTPILLSAGFDPDGQLTQVLQSLSFGGEEIGSITARACKGNPRPHFIRLIRNKSLVVYKGLRNSGVDALISKLSKTPRIKNFVLGISIARTNEKATADIEAGIQDYFESFKKLNESGIGDYYTINISCPNSHTGETFANPESLEKLLSRLREISCDKPVYIKMPINTPWEQFVKLADLANKYEINGLVISNVNKDYKDLEYPEDAPKEFRGGLSGAPCFARSNELIRKTRKKYGKRFTIIGVGGILTPDDAMEKFAAGADLIELITGMIFEGPGLIKEICKLYSKQKGNTLLSKESPFCL